MISYLKCPRNEDRTHNLKSLRKYDGTGYLKCSRKGYGTFCILSKFLQDQFARRLLEQYHYPRYNNAWTLRMVIHPGQPTKRDDWIDSVAYNSKTWDIVLPSAELRSNFQRRTTKIYPGPTDQFTSLTLYIVNWYTTTHERSFWWFPLRLLKLL